MKVKVRVKIQDEKKEKMSYDSADHAENETNIKNQDEIIEFISNEFGALKMQFSALKKEYDMICKQNGYLKAENERLHRSEENNIGVQASMKDLCSRYHKLNSDYDDLKAKYDKLEADGELHSSMEVSLHDKYRNIVLDYDRIKNNYRSYLNTIIEACKEKLEELNRVF